MPRKRPPPLPIRWTRALTLHPNLTAAQWAVGMALSRYLDQTTGECWPSLATLANDSRLGLSTVKRSLNVLEDLGLIDRQRRRLGPTLNDTTRYTATFPGWWIEEDSLAHGGPRVGARRARGRPTTTPKGRPTVGQRTPKENSGVVRNRRRSVADAPPDGGDSLKDVPVERQPEGDSEPSPRSVATPSPSRRSRRRAAPKSDARRRAGFRTGDEGGNDDDF